MSSPPSRNTCGRDHYTNLLLGPVRADAHSVHPVPFVIWNGRDRDAVSRFDEESVRAGRFGASPVNHLNLLHFLGVVRPGARLHPEMPVERQCV